MTDIPVTEAVAAIETACNHRKETVTDDHRLSYQYQAPAQAKGTDFV